MNHLDTPLPDDAPSCRATPPHAGRLTIDAPTRAAHWLMAVSFAGAWLTAESERWRDLHVTLGYAFGGVVLFRLVYGVLGPRQAHLSMLWRRVSGVTSWLRDLRAGRVDVNRLLTLAMGVAMLLLLLCALPLALSGYASLVEWMGWEDALEELHEGLANVSLTLVLTHLALIAGLSVIRCKNLAQPMLTGRSSGAGPDLVSANRLWLAVVLVLAEVAFVGWQSAQPGAPTQAAQTGHGRTADHGDD